MARAALIRWKAPPNTQFAQRSGTEDHFPSWSPDGRLIAFQRLTNTGRHAGASAIYIVSARGGRPRLVYTMPRSSVNSGAPRWSPDGRGRTLIFDNWCAGGCPVSPPVASVFTIRPDGSRLHRLIHVQGDAYNASYAPDGRRIVFAEGAGDLYIASADGTHIRRLTNAPSADSHAADWRPRP